MEFNRRFSLSFPVGMISDAGIVEIVRLIQSQDLSQGEWREANPDTAWRYLPALPDDWAWTWIVQKGEYAGTFAKRIRSYYFKRYAIKCLDTFIQKIGEVARAYSAEQITYHYDFTATIDWQSGEFGDGGSCYWGSRYDARQMLMDNGGAAIRFYDADGNGYGRAWIFKADDALYIVWNGYAKPFANATLTIARVVAAHFNLSYKKIHLSNNGADGSTLYINSGIGYAVAAPETLDGMTEFDFEWDDPNTYTCESCGEYIHEDDMFVGADDNHYCRECFYEIFGECDWCGMAHYHDNLTYIEGQGDYCERCLDRHFSYCESCEEYHRSEDMREVGGEWFCESCAAERAAEIETEESEGDESE